MSELSDFVLRKRAELEAQVAPLVARQEELKAEVRFVAQELARLMPQLDEVNKAAEALGLAISQAPEPSSQTGRQGVSIKQGVRLVLDSAPEGLTSSQILDRINAEYFDGKLERTSFSPQLSRMKAAREVDVHGDLYVLTEHGRELGMTPSRSRLTFTWTSPEKGAPDAPPSNAPEAGSPEDIFS